MRKFIKCGYHIEKLKIIIYYWRYILQWLMKFKHVFKVKTEHMQGYKLLPISTIHFQIQNRQFNYPITLLTTWPKHKFSKGSNYQKTLKVCHPPQIDCEPLNPPSNAFTCKTAPNMEKQPYKPKKVLRTRRINTKATYIT